MVTSRLNVAERLLLVIGTAALFSVLGLLVAPTTATYPFPGGQIPFNQTVRVLAPNGVAFSVNTSSTTPWIVIILAVGLGTIWVFLAGIVLLARQQPVITGQHFSARLRTGHCDRSAGWASGQNPKVPATGSRNSTDG